MKNEHYSDNQRQSDRQAHEDKSSKGYDSKNDDANQEEEGKGKIATSSPGGSESDDERL